MKRFTAVVTALVISVLLTGCELPEKKSAVEQLIEERVASSESSFTETAVSSVQATVGESESTETAPLTKTEGVDIDLTQLSSTMVYSEVYNMVVSPEEYKGKVVRANGTFSVYYDKTADRYYFSVLIADAGACCSQGLEFVLDGEKVFPRDYPEPDSEITVEGVFDSYTEGDYTYCQLLSARLLDNSDE